MELGASAFVNKPSLAEGRQAALLELKVEAQVLSPYLGIRRGPEKMPFPGTGEKVIFQTRIPEGKGQSGGSSQ